LGYVNIFNVGVKRAIVALAKNNNPAPAFTKDQLTNFGVVIFK